MVDILHFYGNLSFNIAILFLLRLGFSLFKFAILIVKMDSASLITLGHHDYAIPTSQKWNVGISIGWKKMPKKQMYVINHLT